MRGELITCRHIPYLYSERAAALGQLKRFVDALADCDEGLKQDDMEATARALLLRGRGFVLTELNRLDEAEDAYNQSLEFDPGNQHALHELNYIASLRAGAPKLPAGPPIQAYPPKQ
ncbi:MAG: tetratricopeptide repeat protein [Rhizomicrobium sp.]|jgi:tetratricopeptide (TPR) repeat protein